MRLLNFLLSRDVTSVLSVQMYMIVTLEVVYDHVGKCRYFKEKIT